MFQLVHIFRFSCRAGTRCQDTGLETCSVIEMIVWPIDAFGHVITMGKYVVQTRRLDVSIDVTKQQAKYIKSPAARARAEVFVLHE